MSRPPCLSLLFWVARILQVTKAIGKTAQPRWSVRSQDACSCMAVVLPFVAVAVARRRGAPFYRVDRMVAPVQFVPLLRLGCRIDMRSCAVDADASARQYFASQQRESVGGAPWQGRGMEGGKGKDGARGRYG